MKISCKTWLFALTGPTVYRVPSQTSGDQSVVYRANQLEFASSSVIQTGNILFTICKWMCIFCFPWIIPRVFSPQLGSYIKPVGLFGTLYLAAVVARAFGRLKNPSYQEFMAAFCLAETEKSDSAIEKLTLYAFSSKWPSQFDVRKLPPAVSNRPQVTVASRSEGLPTILRPLTWFIAKTIGISLVYPGCTRLINSRTLEMRLNSRDTLRRMFSLKMIGLNTRDGEFVEAFYVDRRGSSSNPEPLGGQGDSKGDILLVCCEGNGSYPEVGVALVPLEQGYSVLAWNHPGFGQSTGSPFPQKEHNAVEAVMLFATEHLKFPIDRIYLFGWSIGAYSASWAAMNFPNVGGLILDATFDDLDELASRAMPDLFYPLAMAALHEHLDLNNAANVKLFDGPVRFIRRGDDEIISTAYPPTRETNRGNFLFIKFLRHRYPHLTTPENVVALERFLSLDAAGQEEFLRDLQPPLDQQGQVVCHFLRRELTSHARHMDQNAVDELHIPRVYPSKLGNAITDSEVRRSMLFYLVTCHFAEAPGSHCSPLSPDFLQLPWSPLTDSQESQNTSNSKNGIPVL